MIDDHEKKLAKNPGHTQFICSINDYQYKDIILYTKIINNIANQQDEDIVCKFKRIVSHKGPLND